MFKIGEFSKIAQVAVSQLRYYDEVGLLKPAKVDEWTGYRYYSAQQLPRLNRILALKELGLSLEQIGRMLNDDISAEEIRGMLALKKAQAEQAVRDELTRLRSIEARLQQIESGGHSGRYDIVIKSIPAQPYLSLRKICPSFDAARTALFEMSHALPAAVGKKNLGYFTSLLRSEGYADTDVDLEIGFVLQDSFHQAPVTLPSGQVMTLSTLPAVETMVTAVFTGTFDMSHPCRAGLADWMESNGYEFDGDGREVFIVPPLPGKEDEAVIEIQYPVTQPHHRQRLTR